MQGTLDVLILKALALAPMHGWGITLHIQRISNEVLRVEEGSLYPALQRLLQRDWITAQWKTSPKSRRAKYYRLTPLERWQESMKLWEHYLLIGGSLDPEPDTQSPFYDDRAPSTRPVDGRSGLRVLRRGGV